MSREQDTDDGHHRCQKALCNTIVDVPGYCSRHKGGAFN